MARQKGLDEKIQVTRGFVTEFTSIAFPQNAAIDIDNCIIDTDGSVRRRPGLDLEPNYVLNLINGEVIQSTDLIDLAFSTQLWKFVNNSGTTNFVVQQIGTILQIYNQRDPISSNHIEDIDLSSFATDVVEMAKSPMEITSGLGDLFIVNEFMEPLKIHYTGTTFTITSLLIDQRDFEGVEEVGVATDKRSTALTLNHYYNLRNQGWVDKNILNFASLPEDTDICATVNIDSLPAALNGVFPSNADIMSVGMVVDGSGNLVFDKDFIKEDFLGNTPAPKGHFILRAFEKDRASLIGCTGPEIEVISTRPQAVVFHQGRIFYTFPAVGDRGNGIFYSQQLITDDKAPLCYQEADPTATEINDLVATDGGFLPTPGVGQIFRMQELSNGIVILSSNGVWYLTGAEAGGAFTATSLRLDRIHSSGVVSASSVVQVENSIYFWGVEGILQIVVDTSGTAQVQNLTQNTIQSFYININAVARKAAIGVFIPEQRKIYWTYRDTPVDAALTIKSANRLLILDLDVKGFYKYSIGEDAENQFPEILGLTLVEPVVGAALEEDVTDSIGDVVTTDALVTITADINQDIGQRTQLELATAVFDTTGYKITFSTFNSSTFLDWAAINEGLAMDAFVEFAEFTMGAAHTKGKPTYVHSFFSAVSKNFKVGGYYELP